MYAEYSRHNTNSVNSVFCIYYLGELYTGYYRIAGNFRIVQFFMACLWTRNKNHENFYERILEVEDGPPSLFQDLCGSPPCASFAARWMRKYKQQKDCGGDRFHDFLLRQWWKASKPTGIAGPLFLAKKCLAWGKLATGSIFHWREDSAGKCDAQRHDQLLRPACLCENKTVKISSKANTAFLWTFAPANISRYMVIWYPPNWNTVF